MWLWHVFISTKCSNSHHTEAFVYVPSLQRQCMYSSDVKLCRDEGHVC